MKKLKGFEPYYAIICKENNMICGVYCSIKEAKVAAKEIEECPSKHVIKKCNITIEYER